MNLRIKLSALWLSLVIATSANATVFNYSGTITDGTEPLVSLMPVGAGFNGFFDITSPGAGTTSDNPMIINSIEILLTDTVTGDTIFCFQYNAACGVTNVVVDFDQISLNLAFNILNEPANGIIELTGLTSTSFPLFATFDLTAGVFLIGSPVVTLGEVSGIGSFDTTPVPVPASFWLLITAVGLLAPTASKKHQSDRDSY